MKKILLYSVLVILCSCSGVKRTQEALNTGNYDKAIQKAITSIAENKNKKGNQPFIALLEEAYDKNTTRTLQDINFLKKGGNPANFEEVYNSYVRLKSIQQQIRPLLPLRLFDENRTAKFNFTNYDNELIAAKEALSAYLYDNAVSLLENAVYKTDYRKAYDDLKYLDELHPNYKDAVQKMDIAYKKGVAYVMVEMTNKTDKVIPVRLEEELLNLNTLGLNDLWTAYHTNKIADQDYD